MGKYIRFLDFIISIPFAFLLRFRKGKQICLYGFYGAKDASPIRNQGDNAILESILSFVKPLKRPLLLCLLEPNKKYEADGKVVFIKRRGIQIYSQWLAVIAQSKILVFGGGGLFQDYQGNGGSTHHLWRINFLFFLANRKIIWWSQGVGPLPSEKSKIYTTRAASYADMITLRDEESRQLLLQCGIPSNKLITTADAVYKLPSTYFKQKSQTSSSSKKTKVGISLFSFYTVAFQDELKNETLYNEYKTLIEMLLKQDFIVELIVMVNTQDAEICLRIQNEFKNQNISVRGINLSLDEITSTISDLDVMLAMRYHSYVLSILAGIPVSAVAYHPKVRSLTSELNAWDFSSEIDDVCAKKLYNNILYALKNRTDIIDRQNQLLTNKQDLIHLNEKHLLRILEAS